MMKKVSIYRRWTGPAPPGVPRSQWPRKRKHVWVVRWCTPEGKMPQVTCKTRAEAELIRSEKEVEFDRVPAARNKPREITLGTFIEEFLVMRTGPRGQRLSDGTLLAIKPALARFEAFVGIGTFLSRITPADAARFIAALRDMEPPRRPGKKLSAATVNKAKRALSSVFSTAITQLGYLRVNPFVGIRQDKVAETPIRYVTKTEFFSLLDAAGRRRANQLWWQTFIALCYTAGTRLNEAINLAWADVDFEADAVRIIAKREAGDLKAWQPKDLDSRTVPIPKVTVDLLSRMQAVAAEGSPYVLMSADRVRVITHAQAAGTWIENGQILNNLRHRWLRIIEAARIAHATIHDLRRSAITNWGKVLPIHVVMELAGHAAMETTRKYYLAITPADMESARKATEDAIKRT